MRSHLNSDELHSVLNWVNESSVPPVKFAGRPVRSISENWFDDGLTVSCIDRGSSKSDTWCRSTEYTIGKDDPVLQLWWEAMTERFNQRAVTFYKPAPVKNNDPWRKYAEVPHIDLNSISPELLQAAKELGRVIAGNDKVRKAAFDTLRACVDALEDEVSKPAPQPAKKSRKAAVRKAAN